MNIPKRIMDPFGYTGIPQLYCEEMREKYLMKMIKEISEKIDRQNHERAMAMIKNPEIRRILDSIQESMK